MGNKIGALWINESKNGKKYMSGTIEINGEKKQISISKNQYKKDKQPDYNIFLKENKKEENTYVDGTIREEDLPF